MGNHGICSKDQHKKKTHPPPMAENRETLVFEVFINNLKGRHLKTVG